MKQFSLVRISSPSENWWYFYRGHYRIRLFVVIAGWAFTWYRRT